MSLLSFTFLDNGLDKNIEIIEAITVTTSDNTIIPLPTVERIQIATKKLVIPLNTVKMPLTKFISKVLQSLVNLEI